METLGNLSLLEQPLHGFVCSRTAKSSIILPCLDWAAAKANGSEPVVSTFHSQVEKAVLDILLAGKCPIVVVLGRKLYKEVPENWQKPIEDGRLLLVSLSEQTRISQQSALACNQFIADKSQDVTVGFASPGGNLEKILERKECKVSLIER